MAANLDRPLGFFFAVTPSELDVPETADFRGSAQDELPADLAQEMKCAKRHHDATLDRAGSLDRRISEGVITWKTVARRAVASRNLFGLTDTFVTPAPWSSRRRSMLSIDVETQMGARDAVLQVLSIDV